jgi:hypothetical protein
LLLAAGTYFAARSVGDLLAMWRAAPPASTAKAAREPRSQQHLVRASYEEIVERDVFNAVKQSAHAEPVVETVDLHLKLVGTSHLSMAQPFAIIEDQHSNQQNLYKLGAEVGDAGKLIRIEKDRVVIDHSGRLVAIEIPKDASTPASATSQAPKSRADEMRRRIRQQRLDRPQTAQAEAPDREARRRQREADRAARRQEREARRLGRSGANPGAQSQSQPPRARPAPGGQNPQPPSAPAGASPDSD